MSTDHGHESRRRRPTRRKRHTLPRTRSSSRRKQQTLTQMDFVSFHTTDPGEADLEYVQDSEIHDTPVKAGTANLHQTSRVSLETEDDHAQRVDEEDTLCQDTHDIRPLKRRREAIVQFSETSKIYSRVQTRSSTRRKSSNTEGRRQAGDASLRVAANLEMRELATAHAHDVNRTGSRPNLSARSHDAPGLSSLTPATREVRRAQNLDAIRMPPPCTPQKQRVKEIPSSQSPPATPWSTTTRISLKSRMHSPLQQKSANVTRSSYISPVRRKKRLLSTVSIQDTVNEDDNKENYGTPMVTRASIRHWRRTPALSARYPQDPTASSSDMEREVMMDLARITSATVSTIAEQKSHMDMVTEIGDSDGGGVSEEEVVENHDELRVAAGRQTGLGGHLALSDIVHVTGGAPASTEYALDEAEPGSCVDDSSPVSGCEAGQAQSRLSVEDNTPVKPGILLDAQADPSTPSLGLCDPAFDDASAQLQENLTTSVPAAFVSSTPNGSFDSPGKESPDSPSPARRTREGGVPSSCCSTQRTLECSAPNVESHQGVDLGILAGWRRITDSERCDDSLLKDSLDIEDTWDLEVDLATQRL